MSSHTAGITKKEDMKKETGVLFPGNTIFTSEFKWLQGPHLRVQKHRTNYASIL